MSRPRGVRTGLAYPALFTTSAKRSICSQSEHSYGAPGHGLNGNEIDLGGNAGQQAHQLARFGQAVVDALQHDVFEGDAPRVRQHRIVAARLEQLGDRILAVDRHQLVAQLIAHRMQRDGERRAGLGAPARDLRHDARRRQRDAPLRHRQRLAVGGQLHRRLDVVEVVERLAHAHEHDVGDLAIGRRQQASIVGLLGTLPIADAVARQEDLADDLLRREIANEALRARMAEGAVERAADLAGDAQRAALGLRNVDGLDFRRLAAAPQRGQPQQPLARAVDRHLLGDDLRPRQRVAPARARRAAPWRRRSWPRNRRRRARRASYRAG